jgi:trk system potassium uptake protein TrkA
MKIIILGASQVGSSVAQNLASEANDITVVDHNAETLRNLQDHLDIRTVVGHASHPDILTRAGAEDADMLIAVTNDDETNMVACQVAYTLFRTPTKIARVRGDSYLNHPELFCQEAMPVDVLISPEQIVTEYVQRLIETPGALQVLDFADGRVRMVAVKAFSGGPLVNRELRTLSEHIPNVDARVAAIFRDGVHVAPDGNTIVKEGDEIFFVAASGNVRTVMGELGKLDNPVKRIILAGGGNIGYRLAARLEKNYRVKLIERDPASATRLSELLSSTIVLEGDAADEDLLREENIERTDVFCAITNDDQVNILSAMLARRMGARKVMSLINRGAYVDLVQSRYIDIAISPQQATIGTLLAHVRKGDVSVVHSLRGGAAEAIEAIAHGDRRTSKVVDRTVEEVKLPPGATIVAIARESEVVMAHHDTVIRTGDHVILLLLDKKRIPEVERLFQVGLHFL